MKKLFFAFLAAGAIISCGPSSGNATNNDQDVSNSPTGDTAITDHGTGAAKGAETGSDTTQAQ